MNREIRISGNRRVGLVKQMGLLRSRRRASHVSPMLPILLVIGLSLLSPAPAAGQADLIVIPGPTDPSVAPGQEMLIEFAVQNIGSLPTAATAIMNYVFIWDAANNVPETQLSPTETHIAHTLRSLLPTEMDMLGPIAVRIPSDTPMDTTIAIAIVTDWGDLETELDENNNIALIPIAIEPRLIDFIPDDSVILDEIEISGFSDYYHFVGAPGDVVYSEVVAEHIGSSLDSYLGLLGPHPDSLLASDGDIQEIGLDSRVSYIDLPSSPDYFRLEVFGMDSTMGFYELHLQQALPEVEPNDDPTVATPILYNQASVGYISAPGETDFYSFTGYKGDILILDIDADEMFEAPPDSVIDPMVVLYNASMDTILLNDDTDEYDPSLFFVLPDTGMYYLEITDAPGGGDGTGYPEYSYVFKLKQIIGVGKPDLTPMNIAPVVDPVPAGDTVQIDFETWNMGDLSTFAGGVSIDMVLSVDAVIDTSDTLLDVGDFDGDVLPYSFVPTSVQVGIPSTTTPGIYYMGIVLDPTNSEVEEDEDNNAGMVQFEVVPPTGIVKPIKLPRVFALLQNYPNPMSANTTIPFHVPSTIDGRPTREHIIIDIFNVKGERVATLVNGLIASGKRAVQWNGTLKGRPLPSGIYFYRMKSGNFVQTRRLAIIR